ncbi:hypothetical protein D9M69_558230 [compost metagenome]
MLARHPAVTAGGRDVVKMKPVAKERTASMMTWSAAMYPPITPMALAMVPWMISTRSASPSSAAMPAPRGPYMPTACTSSRKVRALCRLATLMISAMGAISPSIEYTDSNTTILGCPSG